MLSIEQLQNAIGEDARKTVTGEAGVREPVDGIPSYSLYLSYRGPKEGADGEAEAAKLAG